MANELVEYMKITKISLEQDLDEVITNQDLIEDWNSQEWQILDIEDVSLTGQILTLGKMIEYAYQLDKAKDDMVG